MPSSERALGLAALLLAVAAPASRAHAQQPAAAGFAVERFYPSAPGGGWFVMDALELQGGLGGALALTLGYAGTPLRVSDGAQTLAAVSDQAFAAVAAAITYDRWRFYVDLDTPLAIRGRSGTVGGYTFTGPSVDLGANPDTLSDARLGADARIVGRPGGRFRCGGGAQLIVPFGSRADYDTDGTFRGMLRALFAGDAGRFSWAGQLGVHIRPLDGATPGSPRGSELLFGVAAGGRLPVDRAHRWVLIVGPEIFGATAFRAFFGADGTALEALVGARLEGTRADRLQLRVKLGIGAGLDPRFGAPDWRLVAGVEMFTHDRRVPASATSATNSDSF